MKTNFFTFKNDTTQKFADQKGVMDFEAALLAALEEALDLGRLTRARMTALKTSTDKMFARKGAAAEKMIHQTVQDISARFSPKRPH